MVKFLVSIIVGAFLGIIAARYLFVGSWLSLIPWAIAGLALGYWSGNRQALINGIAYGFVLCFAFMVAGYSGSEPVLTRLPFFALIGAFGAICGLGLGLIGFQVRKKLAR
jgi:hypothetical protein